MRLRIRNPFYFAYSKWASINCYHCGKVSVVLVSNLRANNYCQECK